jgi:hypothetical protein
MSTHIHGLLAVSPRQAQSPTPESLRERERLRRELLRRIVDRESRRQSARGLFR